MQTLSKNLHPLLRFVTDTRQCDLTIRSNSPEWFHDGIQLFAFERNGTLEFIFDIRVDATSAIITTPFVRSGHLWHKDVIEWAIEKNSAHLPPEIVERIFEKAFAKWSTVIPKTFKRVPSRMNSLNQRNENQTARTWRNAPREDWVRLLNQLTCTTFHDELHPRI